MRFLYLLRVVFISVEAAVLAFTWMASTLHAERLQAIADSISLKEEVLDYLVMLPCGIAAWVFYEARLLLQEDKASIRTLTKWPDYWKLKVHIWVAICYAILFSTLSLLPWVFKTGIQTGTGLLLFVSSILGQSVLAVTVYAASIRIRELLANARILMNSVQQSDSSRYGVLVQAGTVIHRSVEVG